MARPSGTSQYPGDDSILDEIEAALDGGLFPSRLAAIQSFLGRIEGPTEEAKIRRFHRKLKERSEDEPLSEIDPKKLAEALAEIPTGQGRIAYLAGIDKRAGLLVQHFLEGAEGLRRSGVDLSTPEGKAMLRAYVMAQVKDSNA